MALDALCIRVLCRELNEQLRETRVDKISQPNRFDLVLQLHGPGGKLRLKLSANPTQPACYLSERSEKNPEQAPQFCMLLRKHLSGARFIEIPDPSFERLLDFHFSVRNDFGDLVLHRLILEPQGRNSNLLLLNENGMILDCLRHVDESVNRYRELMPARPYLAPPPLKGLQIADLIKESEQEGFSANGFSFLQAAEENEAEQILEKFLKNKICGFSPLLVRELLYRSALAPEQSLGSLSPAKRRLLSEVLRQFLHLLLSPPAAGYLYFRSENSRDMMDFHALALNSLPWRQELATLNQALAQYFDQSGAEDSLKQSRQLLVKKIRQVQKHALRKAEIHRQDLREAAQAEYYRRCGTLLQSQLHLVQAKSRDVRLPDYFAEDAAEISIPLKPELSPSRNVEDYFKRYRKAQSKASCAARWLQQDEAEIEWCESLLIAAENAESREDIELLKQEWQGSQVKKAEDTLSESEAHLAANRLNPGKPGKRGKWGKNQIKRTPGKNKQEQALPPRRFRSSEGFLIEVGRNNLQNDQLSLRQAAKDDLWFHVQKRPGSHVVLHLNGQAASPAALEAAAGLAAWYSRGEGREIAGHEFCEVDYTAVRNLQKPKGARPGKVIYQVYESLRIRLLPPEQLGLSKEND